MSALSETLWVLQSNRLGSAGFHDFFKLTTFLDAQGTPYREFQYRPFDDSPIVVEWDGPVVFYGGTTFIEKVIKQNRWSPGVWYDSAAFSFEALLAGYGKLLLNHDSRVTTIRELLAEDPPKEPFAFIRPVNDLKEFVGSIRSRADIQRDLLTQSSVSRATPETKVQIAPIRKLKREWRTIVVDGKVVAGSQYRDGARLLSRDDPHVFPGEVAALAEHCAQKYSPASVFVLDVCETADGALAVVETNCFNCAGWYESSYRDIARKVTLHASPYREPAP